MRHRAPSSVSGPPEDQDIPTADQNPACGQCGAIGEPEYTFCQSCDCLLPDPDPAPQYSYTRETDSGGGDAGIGPRSRFRLLTATVLLLAVFAGAGLAILQATDPQPEERLAQASSHRALALLQSLGDARTLAKAREISVSAKTALTPVVEMLPKLGSDNDTRPRLDAYRSLFRGMASLEHLHQSSLPEWARTRQLISSSLRELAAFEPMIGLLTTQGRIAIDAVQDQIIGIERSRTVSPRARTVGWR